MQKCKNARHLRNLHLPFSVPFSAGDTGPTESYWLILVGTDRGTQTTPAGIGDTGPTESYWIILVGTDRGTQTTPVGIGDKTSGGLKLGGDSL